MKPGRTGSGGRPRTRPAGPASRGAGRTGGVRKEGAPVPKAQKTLGGEQVEGRQAVRELLALQSSDWAFLVHRELAAAYGHGRAEGHRARLEEELASLGSCAPELRNLAPFATVAPLLA